MTTLPSQITLDLAQVIEEMFMVLTDKERNVIVQRFSLDNKPRRTLESIGQQFSVTRERIRQIEKIALGKLRRTASTTKLSLINSMADEVIRENGGILLESRLVSSILNKLATTSELDSSIIKLALSINPDMIKAEKSNIYKPFWRLSSFDFSLVGQIASAGVKVLKKKGEVMAANKLVGQVRQAMVDKLNNHTDPAIVSSMQVDRRVKSLEDGHFGLMTWRHINPKSIRDKAYIVLKREKKPLHFVEIANLISQSEFDKKVVTTQAVHNELIRYDQFVLVGRGLYALKEFGYSKGTVSDVIEDLLSKNETMTKQEIIDGVLKQRHVKKGTISLNLQKNPYFVRVGRAVYRLDKSKRK